jgi:hypothetical protein
LLVRHGMLRFSSADVMRYFGKRVNQSGDIPAKFNGTLETDLKRRQEGERVKYRMNGNSAKFYDKAYSEIGSVLRGRKPPLTRYKTSGYTGPNREGRNRICNGGACGKASPICIAAPKCHKKPMSDCSTRWPAWTTAAAWKS